jgi:hypothetical protein
VSDLNDAPAVEVTLYTARRELLAAALGYMASETYIESRHTPSAHDDAEMELKEDNLHDAIKKYVLAFNAYAENGDKLS